MIDNFIFSLSAILPIFLVMLIGYILIRNHVIDHNFVSVANNMVFHVALPIKLFNEVRQIHVKEILDVKFILFIVIGTIISALFAWLISMLFVKKESQRGAFIQGAFRGNFLYLGFSLMENVTGTIGMKAPIVVAIVIPLYNILAVIILSVTKVGKKTGSSFKDTIKENVLGIIKNPMIVAIFFGVLVSISNIEIPVFATRTMEYFQDLATPLALLSIGATFNPKSMMDNFKPAMIASTLKLVVFPLTAVIIAYFMGFSNEDLLLIYILFGVPTATVSYIMVAVMDGDKELASSIVMLSTLLSIISITGFIFAFKTIEII